MKRLMSDLVEVSCLLVFLSGIAALAQPGFGIWVSSI